MKDPEVGRSVTYLRNCLVGVVKAEREGVGGAWARNEAGHLAR